MVLVAPFCYLVAFAFLFYLFLMAFAVPLGMIVIAWRAFAKWRKARLWRLHDEKSKAAA